MALTSQAKLRKMGLSEVEITELYRLAKKQDKIESKWVNQFLAELATIADYVILYVEQSGRIPGINSSIVDFEELVLHHSLSVCKDALESLERMPKIPHLGAPPKGKVPRSLRELMDMWDRWRKRKVIPPRQKKIAATLKKAYLQKLNSVFEKYSEEFRQGKAFSSDRTRDFIHKATEATAARAKMIVETETTHYYNQVRRDFYDRSNDVTHYLFVTVRDSATTKWCSTRKGLVYKKGDPLLDDETPPIHWNCRSEILPLTPLNPRHKAIIEDKSKARRNHRCEPLPKDWKH